jgi:S-adenosylmethionine decarboxylase
MRKTAAGQRDSAQPKPSQEHGFIGFHLLANYTGCRREALRDLSGLGEALVRAAKAAGATVLAAAQHVFDNNGLSQVLLLSESHASLHTYPEFCSCFLDLFTCGTTCRPEKFEAIMRDHLRPTGVCTQVMVRHQGIEQAMPDSTYQDVAPETSDILA